MEIVIHSTLFLVLFISILIMMVGKIISRNTIPDVVMQGSDHIGPGDNPGLMDDESNLISILVIYLHSGQV